MDFKWHDLGYSGMSLFIMEVQMSLNGKKPGDVVFETSVDELLRTCGISLAKWSSDILLTDAAYSEGWIEEVSEQMAALSFLCHLFTHFQAKVPRDVMIPMPPEICGVVVVNPLTRGSMDKDVLDNTSESHEGDDLFPF